jgi:phosphotriesterase-related protein
MVREGALIVHGVDGPFAVEELGTTLVHEHLLIDLRHAGYAAPVMSSIEMESGGPNTVAVVRSHPFGLADNLVLDDVNLAVEELAPFAHSGGRTVVELTPIDIGRSPAGLRLIAARTGIQIIMGTGHYRSPSHPPSLTRTTTLGLADEMIGDLMRGVDGSRAGVIGEIGTSDPIHVDEARVIEAAAIAQRDTGRAMFVHVHPWTKTGHRLLDRCERAGADLTRVVLCHMDASLPDTEYHRSLAERGAWVSYDLFGDDRDDYDGRRFPPDSERVRGVIRAFEEGWAGRLLLSHDIALKSRLWRYGGCGYDYIATRIIPRLRSEGLGSDEIDLLSVRNPALVLAHPRDGGSSGGCATGW